MTLQTIPMMEYGPIGANSTARTSTTLDANGEYLAWVVTAPRTGTIRNAHFYCTSKTADGDGLRVGLYSINAADGLIDTLLGSEVTVATTTAASWNRTSDTGGAGSGLNYGVTGGQVIALRVASPAAGTTANLLVALRYGAQSKVSIGGMFPYYIEAVPTATKGGGNMSFPLALEYSDGSIYPIPNCIPVEGFASTTFNSGSAADERGVLFQVPFQCQASGVYVAAEITGDTNIVLYSGTSALETISADKDIKRSTGQGGYAYTFSAPVTLSAATDYRLVLKPTSATNTVLYHATINTSVGGTALRNAFMGSTWQQTTRADAGAWTDTQDTVPLIGLLIDQLDDGASAITLTGLT